MFKKLFKKKAKSSTNITPYVCSKDNELLLQLRKCQDLKKTISQEIENFSKDNHELFSYFANFFSELVTRVNSYEPEREMYIINRTIQERSSAEIFKIAEDLKAYKDKDDIIHEKRRALKAVEDDIERIKAELGIE